MSKKLLLKNDHIAGINTLPVYREHGGYTVLANTLKNLTPDAVVEEVKKLGCKVAIDDFGSGSNVSFKELAILKFDIIKIDGSYIKNIFTNPNDLIFVEAVIKFAKKNNVQIVAEYIENKELAKYLSELDVTFLQGNYFSSASTTRFW
jgi:EAL domain-containing protein (putative c-di-GMP-specific phosphodiesterase class I)